MVTLVFKDIARVCSYTVKPTCYKQKKEQGLGLLFGFWNFIFYLCIDLYIFIFGTIKSFVNVSTSFVSI